MMITMIDGIINAIKIEIKVKYYYDKYRNNVVHLKSKFSLFSRLDIRMNSI
jgi:hypothetical protein